MTTTRRPGNLLKVHSPRAETAPVEPLNATQGFWQAFAEATGWAPVDGADPAQTRSTVENVELRAALIDGLLDAYDLEGIPIVTRDHASQLANSAMELLRKLSRAESTIKNLESELASRALPRLSPRGGSALARRLTAALRESCTATRCQAAGLYMLDDLTTHLKLRARFGIPLDRLQAPPRPLRGSMADLEALVSGLAVMPRLTGNPQWSSPEPWEAGMCAAVMLDDLPIGTLWLWRNRCGKFGRATQAAARLAAQRISLELQASVAKQRQRHASQTKRLVREGKQWQDECLPPDVPLARDWHTAGWIDQPRELSSVWYTWDVQPDGMLALAMGQGLGRPGMGNALTATTLRAAWQAHSGYRHSTQQVVRRVADTLWQASSEPPHAAMLYARLNPDTGEGEISWAGHLPVLIASSMGYRPACESQAPLGSHPDLIPRCTQLRLQPGETLVVATPEMFRDPGTSVAGRMSQQEFAGLIRAENAQGLAHVMTELRRSLALPRARGSSRAIVLMQRAAAKPARGRKRTSSASPRKSSRAGKGTQRPKEE